MISGHPADRKDGLLVHLDGLNFSRAWNLYSLVAKLTNEREGVRYEVHKLQNE